MFSVQVVVFLEGYIIFPEFYLHFISNYSVFSRSSKQYRASQVVLVVNNPSANVGDVRDPGSIPGSEVPLEEGMATYSNKHAWRIPRTEEPGGLQSIGSQRVGHD